MNSTTYDKRIFSPRVLAGDLGFLLSRAPAIARAMRNPDIGRAFVEKIMIVVTAINGCTYCSWFHARQALAGGIANEEIRDLFDLQFHASANERELPALLFAQHFAETNRDPDPEMIARLHAFYGERTAADIVLLIRTIFFGNLFGNTFDAFPSRLAGRKAENSSALFELIFFVASAWFMLPLRWLSRDGHQATIASTS